MMQVNSPVSLTEETEFGNIFDSNKFLIINYIHLIESIFYLFIIILIH